MGSVGIRLVIHSGIKLLMIDRPDGVCFALLHILDLYTWRVWRKIILT
jgi:hypothetical protein